MERVLVVHNRYRSEWPSGEDQVFDAEVDQLRRYGHEVVTFERDNDSIRGVVGVALAGLASIWNPATSAALRRQIASFRPDVVHLHNTFPLISPAAMREAAMSGAMVVMTLHNYRTACVVGTLFRDGRPCEACIVRRADGGGSSRIGPALRHGCYRDSRLATLAPAAGQALHRALRTWERYVDRYIAPSFFAKQKLISAGIPDDKISVKSHFLHPAPEPAVSHEGPALFLGRLDSVKGADVLLEAWHDLGPIPLMLVGDGPLRQELEARAAKLGGRIEFTGKLDHASCLRILRDARMLVFPSRAYETFGLAVRDAMALGKPIVATDRGAAAELLDHGRSALLFQAGDAASLAAAVRLFSEDRDLQRRLGRAAREQFEARLCDAPAYEGLMQIYRSGKRRSSED